LREWRVRLRNWLDGTGSWEMVEGRNASRASRTGSMCQLEDRQLKRADSCYGFIGSSLGSSRCIIAKATR
jgi:hypothetical protein